MWQILVVTDRRTAFQGALQPLETAGRCAPQWADSRQAAMDAVGRRPDLVIVDQQVAGQAGLALCRDLLGVDAFVNLALVSDLDDEAFHEASEGLGLVGRLPSSPTAADLTGLLARLAQISSPG